MFELITGTLDRPFRDTRIAPTVFSVVAHILIIGGVVGATLFVVTGGLPQVPAMLAFVAEMPAPPPPPPPPPAPGPPAKTAQPTRPLPTKGDFTFPVQAPAGITEETGITTGVDEGVPGGVEGGIPGGIVGGVVGGILTDVPPPPPPLPPPPPPPPPPQKLAAVRVGGEIKAPELIYRVEPVYPDIAIMANATGVVILEATVNEQGEVTNVVVLRSRKLLDQAAIDAVKQWRYTPLLLNGVPRAFILTVTLNFSLR